MFGRIPHERIHPHDWREWVHASGRHSGCVREGKDRRRGGLEVSRVTLNTMLMKETWDLVINIGHVVPHEVLGFANHNKNYFIGLGGKATICAAHMAAACYGIENNLGNLITPCAQCFNWAEEKFLGHLPDVYVQVVMRPAIERGNLCITGVSMWATIWRPISRRPGEPRRRTYDLRRAGEEGRCGDAGG